MRLNQAGFRIAGQTLTCLLRAMGAPQKSHFRKAGSLNSAQNTPDSDEAQCEPPPPKKKKKKKAVSKIALP